MQEKKFDKKEYDAARQRRLRKENPKARIVIDLSFEEKEEIKSLLNKHNLTYVQFFKKAIEELKKKN